MTAQADGETPGYCEACREFCLLTAVEVPAIGAEVMACRNCAAMGPVNLAWQVAGIGENGEFRAGPDPSARTRGRRDPLAESLTTGGPGGFGRGKTRFRDRWRDRAWLLRECLRAWRQGRL